MLVDQDLIKLVKKNELFDSVDQTFVDSFIKPKNFFIAKDGTMLYSYGDESIGIYLIVEGECKIKHFEGKKIEFKYLLDFFGEKEILDDSKRNTSAIANKDCILYHIGKDSLKFLTTSYTIVNDNLTKIRTKHKPDHDLIKKLVTEA